jgi:NADH:ubiquinone reductase (H+-translocating)
MASMKATRKVIIVGAGYAGLEAAQGLAQSKDVQVTVFDPHPFQTLVTRLDRYVARDLPVQVDLKQLARESGFDVEQTKVSRYDPESHQVVLEDGRRVSYDALVIAAGARARRASTTSTHPKPTYSLRTFDEAKRLHTQLRRLLTQAEHRGTLPLRISIVGSGHTGTQLAQELSAAWGNKVQVLLAGYAPAPEGEKERLEALGVTLKDGVSAQVTDLGVLLQAVNGGQDEERTADLVVWTAGDTGAAHELNGKDLEDSAQRLQATPTLQRVGASDIFVAGDAGNLPDSARPRGAEQSRRNAQASGSLVARNILHLFQNEPLETFTPVEKPTA